MEKTILFIRKNGGKIKDTEAKERLLKSYCREQDLEVVDIIQYEDYDGKYYPLLDLIRERVKPYALIHIVDYSELADSLSELYVILEMLADYNYYVTTLFMGTYFKNGIGDSPLKFKVNIINKKLMHLFNDFDDFENYESEY